MEHQREVERERDREQERKRQQEIDREVEREQEIVREQERQREIEREREWEKEQERQREIERWEEAQRERERWEEEKRERKRQDRMRTWEVEFRRKELLETIKKSRIQAKMHFLWCEGTLLRRRKEVLSHIRMKQGSKRHLIKRKDVKKLGAKLFWRGLRSLATHSLLTVCTKWALLTDKENFIRIGKVTLVRYSPSCGFGVSKANFIQDLQALMDSWDSTRTVIDGLLAMDFMVDTWGQMTDMSPGSLTSQNAADWDQIERKCITISNGSYN